MQAFRVGQLVYWHAREGHVFRDPISATRFPMMEGVGKGPFRVTKIEDSPDPIEETGHPQIVTIETPVGERRLSGWWLHDPGA